MHINFSRLLDVIYHRLRRYSSMNDATFNNFHEFKKKMFVIYGITYNNLRAIGRIISEIVSTLAERITFLEKRV